MHTELMLKSIMEDLAAIKSQMGNVIRTTQIVKGHQEQLTRIVNKFDSCEKRLGKAELSIATNTGKASGNTNFAMWVAAFASAFLIAVLIINMKPATGAMIHKEQKALVTEIVKVKDRKDD